MQLYPLSPNKPAIALSQCGFNHTQIDFETSFSFFFVSTGAENVLLTACIELHERNALVFHIPSVLKVYF